MPVSQKKVLRGPKAECPPLGEGGGLFAGGLISMIAQLHGFSSKLLPLIKHDAFSSSVSKSITIWAQTDLEGDWTIWARADFNRNRTAMRLTHIVKARQEVFNVKLMMTL